MEVERNLNEAAAMQSGLNDEERQQHLAEVQELKTEIASQAAATARLRQSLEQRSDVIERLTANDVQQQQKIDSLKVRQPAQAISSSCMLVLHPYNSTFQSQSVPWYISVCIPSESVLCEHAHADHTLSCVLHQVGR